MIEYLQPFFMGALWALQVVLIYLVPMLLVELVAPARRMHVPTVLFNFLYAPFYLTVAAALLHPVSVTLSPWMPQNLFGLSLATAPAWQAGLVVAAYLVAFDFFFYWFHRAQHAWPLMWRFHRFHHADPNVSLSSSTRHHWLEEAMRYFMISIPLLLLFGSPERTFPWLGVLLGVSGMFIHWNVRLHIGPIGHVFVGPQYHRVHHSLEDRHHGKNFAVIFSFWDRLFGTQHMPARDEFVTTGLVDARSPNHLRLLGPLPPLAG